MNVLKPWVGGLVLSTCATAALAAQQLEAQAPATERSYRVPSFDKVAAAGPNLVIVKLGGAPVVTAQGPTAMLDRM